ncbi:hypothetical protein G6F63_016523 [Rhizopus arrhizus]|uniref:Uncharacterized protein n=1 Tax=Rhizopus delemar TaxID=936053 RepID=A0A9P7C0H0_9FUNG|nr:hypothetical protein G6F63_016523 [Rhizopus arrhizus]KAG1529923.1 hypothetical protein G6F50_017667 [Rhizopus delemar]
MLHAAQQEARFIGAQLAVDQGRQLFAVALVQALPGRGLMVLRFVERIAGQIAGHTRLFSRVALPMSNSGRSSVSIASRARKIRERTVPIGHPIFCAISS